MVGEEDTGRSSIPSLNSGSTKITQLFHADPSHACNLLRGNRPHKNTATRRRRALHANVRTKDRKKQKRRISVVEPRIKVGDSGSERMANRETG